MRMRRYLVAHMLRDFGMEWGAQTRMAEEFGVSRSTAAGPESKRRRHETRMSHLRYATHAGGVAEGRPVGAGVVEVVGGTETAPA